MSIYIYIYIYNFFPGVFSVIAQDIRKAKSEKIEVFKNTLNKLLNIKSYFIIYNCITKNIITFILYIASSKLTTKLRVRSNIQNL